MVSFTAVLRVVTLRSSLQSRLPRKGFVSKFSNSSKVPQRRGKQQYIIVLGILSHAVFQKYIIYTNHTFLPYISLY